MSRFVEKIISLPLWLLIPIIPCILTHWDMVKGDYKVKKLKKASYSELKAKMLSVEWEYDPKYPCSLFDKNDYNANYFHGSIFRFGDVGYLLTIYGLIRANMLQRKIRKGLPSYVTSKKMYV